MEVKSHPGTGTKPRNPFIAFLLSLFAPGLGQVYNGQTFKAFAIVFSELIIPIFFRYTAIIQTDYGIVLFLIIILGLFLFTIVDAFIVAKRKQNYQPKSYENWYFYIAIGFCIFLVSTVFFNPVITIGIRNFAIVSPSMSPNYNPGDLILVDLKYYKNKDVKRGDVVAFNSSHGGIWIERVIGLPNEKISMTYDTLIINNQPSQLVFEKYINTDYLPGTQFKELLPGFENHIILLDIPKGEEMVTPLELQVPENSYFLLGDNRNNVVDSRMIGCIPKEKIAGKVLFTYWKRGKKRENEVHNQEQKLHSK